MTDVGPVDFLENRRRVKPLRDVPEGPLSAVARLFWNAQYTIPHTTDARQSVPLRTHGLVSHEKVFVLYIQRNPDKRLPTRGFIAPLCLSAVRSYGLLLGMSYVVIDNPIPQAREAYEREGFVQLPGVGLAYDLAQDYDESIDEVLNYDA